MGACGWIEQFAGAITVCDIYTIEKQGRRKLVYQTPWYEAGAVAGLVEVVLELPAEMPHFVRQG